MTDLEQQYAAYRQKPGVCRGCDQGVRIGGIQGRTHFPEVNPIMDCFKCEFLPILEWADQRDKAKDQRITELEEQRDFARDHASKVAGLTCANAEYRLALKAKGEEIAEWREEAWRLKMGTAGCQQLEETGPEVLDKIHTLTTAKWCVQYDRAEAAEALAASQAREIGELREGLKEIHASTRNVPDQLGRDRNGDCDLSRCECSNHLVRALLSRTGEPQEKPSSENLTTNADPGTSERKS